jgi:hypothetical protein
MTPDHWTHGLRHTYSVYKCRCDACTQANRDYMRAYQQRDSRREYRRSYGQRYRAAHRGRLLPLVILPT